MQGQAAELEGALHKREAEVERLRAALAEAGVDAQALGSCTDPVSPPACQVFNIYQAFSHHD